MPRYIFSRVLFAVLLLGSAASFAVAQPVQSAQDTSQQQTVARGATNNYSYTNTDTASPVSNMSSGSNSSALNWSGYVASDGTYTSVSATWVVPSVANASVNSADATWVGIGGTRSQDLIQAGTEAIPTSAGTVVYQAWYETLPQSSTPVPLTISPGDSVAVSITEESSTDNEWLISFRNATTGQSYQTTVQYRSSLSSAEWIEEMPIEVGGLVGLDDFGTIDFSNGYAIKNGQSVTIAVAGAQPLTMDNAQGAAIATPSALGEDGASFSVSRSTALATPLALTRGGIRAVSVSPMTTSGYTASYGSIGSGYGGYGGFRGHHGGRGGYRIVISF